MGKTLNRNSIFISTDGKIQFFHSESKFQPTSSAPATAASFHIIVDENVGGSIISDSAMNPYIKFSIISSSFTNTGVDEELIIRFFTSSHFADRFTNSFTGNSDLLNVSQSFKEFYYTSSNTFAEYRDIRVFATASDSDGDANTEYATVLRNKIHDAITGSKFVLGGSVSQSKSGNNTSSIFFNRLKGVVPAPVFHTGSLAAYGASVTSSFKVQTISTGSGTLNYSDLYVLSDDSASYIIGTDPTDKISFQISVGTASLAHTGSQATQSILLYASGGAGGEGRVGFGTTNPKTRFDFKGDGFKVRSSDGKREFRFEDDGRLSAKKYANSATSESVGSEIQLSYTPGSFTTPTKAQVGETVGTINWVDESFNAELVAEDSYLKSGSIAQITSTVRSATTDGVSGDLQFKVNDNPSNPSLELTSFLTIDPQTYGKTVYIPHNLTVSGSTGGHITASGNISASGDITSLSGSFTRLDADKGKLQFRDFGWRTHKTVASTAQGDIIYHYTSVATTAGQIYHLNTNGNLSLSDADAVGTATGSLFVALDDNANKGLLIRGFVRLAEDPGETANVGQPLFLSTTAGQVSATAPTGTGDTVRIVGFYMSGSGEIYFNPDNSSIVLS